MKTIVNTLVPVIFPYKDRPNILREDCQSVTRTSESGVLSPVPVCSLILEILTNKIQTENILNSRIKLKQFQRQCAFIRFQSF